MHKRTSIKKKRACSCDQGINLMRNKKLGALCLRYDLAICKNTTDNTNTLRAFSFQTQFITIHMPLCERCSVEKEKTLKCHIQLSCVRASLSHIRQISISELDSFNEQCRGCALARKTQIFSCHCWTMTFFILFTPLVFTEYKNKLLPSQPCYYGHGERFFLA